MKTAVVVMTVLVLVGCALTVEAQTVVVGQAPATGKFSGEAWTWDSARSIVTLYDSGRQFRVQTTPDQIAPESSSAEGGVAPEGRPPAGWTRASR